MRLGTLIGAALPCLALAACGADDPPQRKAPAPVRLQISAPSDTATVNDDTVEVRGTVVPPGARVRVLGRVASVSGGTFSAVVALEQGSNVIDVAASARGRTAAFAAVRIARQDLVTVPELGGVAADEAEADLQGLGLRGRDLARRWPDRPAAPRRRRGVRPGPVRRRRGAAGNDRAAAGRARLLTR